MVNARFGSHVNLRSWHKRHDRSSIGHWPVAQLPAHWGEVTTHGPRVSFAVDLASGPLLIGRITLRDRFADSAELGMYMHPEYVGRGFGSEALRLFFVTAQEDLQLTHFAAPGRGR
jgi:RimJ/RimL family protein N-acetyltransferase